MLKTFRSATFQSINGFIFGLISWLAPAGVVFALVAIIFGFIGLYRSSSYKKVIFWVSLFAIILGSSARLIYAFSLNNGITAALVITAVSFFATVYILFRKNQLKTLL